MPSPSAAQALQTALKLHQSGQTAEAEAIYRQVLAADATNADATHFLGLLLQQRGDHRQAADLLAKASSAKPDDAQLLGALGVSLGISGKLDEAIAALSRAHELQPELKDVVANLFHAHITRAQG